MIRDERASDRDAIRHVHEEAFGGPLEARLVDLLRERNKVTLSLVAAIDGVVVGHILFSAVTITGVPAARAVGLAPVGVLPTHQKNGVGSALVREGLARCKRAGYGLVVLIGEPAYYRRFGFRSAKRFGFDNEYGVGDEFMVLELNEHGLPDGGGLVQYAPEFTEAEAGC